MFGIKHGSGKCNEHPGKYYNKNKGDPKKEVVLDVERSDVPY